MVDAESARGRGGSLLRIGGWASFAGSLARVGLVVLVACCGRAGAAAVAAVERPSTADGLTIGATTLEIYPTPTLDGQPVYRPGSDLTVTVNGRSVDVIQGPRPAGFRYLDARYVRFSFSGLARVTVTKRSGIGTSPAPSISPLAADIHFSVSSDRTQLSFSLTTPQYVVVMLDQIKLIVLADPLDADAPDPGPGVIDVSSLGTPASGLYTTLIQSAIDQLSLSGGGTVYFPAGAYPSSTIYLKSNVKVYLDGGAVILGTPDPDAYPDATEVPGFPTIATISKLPRGIGSGGSVQGEAPLVALIVIAPVDSITPRNAAVLGRGVIDMNGFRLPGNDGNRIASTAIHVDQASDVRIKGVVERGARYWANTLLSASYVVVDRLKIIQFEGEDVNDGIAVCNSAFVSVTNGFALTGGDGYSVSSLSSRPDDTTHDVTFDHNLVFSGSAGFSVGPWIYSHLSKIVFSSSTLMQTVSLKIEHRYGTSTADTITFTDLDVERIDSAFTCTSCGIPPSTSVPGDLHPIDFRAFVDSTNGPTRGFSGPVRGVTVANVTFPSCPECTTPSVIAGASFDGLLSGIRFANVKVDGAPISGVEVDPQTTSGVTFTAAAPALVAPTITSQPRDATVGERSEATFTVLASGSAPLFYQWQKDGVDIPDAIFRTFSLANPGTWESGSLLTVRVSNAAGTARSAPARLTVGRLVRRHLR